MCKLDDSYPIMSRENDKIFDVRSLEAFQAAMSCGSMTGAARQLGIGQPTVTRLVKDLEADVGFQLFHRNGPRISPTDRGLRFYEEVHRLISGLRQIRDHADAIREDRLPAIDIAATPAMAGGLIGPALEALGADLPDYVNLQTMNAEYVVRALRNRTADLGIAAFPMEHLGLARHVICESRLVAVVASDTPLARAHHDRPLPLSVFANTRLITVGNAFRIRHAIDVALGEQGIAPARELSTNSSLNAIMVARSGLGAAIVDPVTAFGIPVDGVTILPLETPVPYFWGLLSEANRVFAPSQMRFVDAFRTACRDTIPDCTFHDPLDASLLKRIEQMLRT